MFVDMCLDVPVQGRDFMMQKQKQPTSNSRAGWGPKGTKASSNGAGVYKPSVTAGFPSVSPCSASLHFLESAVWQSAN